MALRAPVTRSPSSSDWKHSLPHGQTGLTPPTPTSNKSNKNWFQTIGIYMLIAGSIVVIDQAMLNLQQLSQQLHGVNSIWPSTGVALGLVAVFGLRFWPAVLLGSMGGFVLKTVAFYDELGLWRFLVNGIGPPVADAISCYFGAQIILGQKRLTFRIQKQTKTLWSQSRPVMDRTAEITRFVVFCGLFLPALNTLISISSYLIIGKLEFDTGLASRAFAWMVSDSISVLLITPLIVACVDKRQWTVFRYHSIQLFFWFFCALVLMGLIATNHLLKPTNVWTGVRSVAPIALGIPLVLWAALAFERIGATAAMFIGTISLLLSPNPFGLDQQLQQNSFINQVFIQAGITITAMTVLLTSAAASQRRQLATVLKGSRLAREAYQSALLNLSRHTLIEQTRFKKQLATQLHDSAVQYIALAQMALGRHQTNLATSNKSDKQHSLTDHTANPLSETSQQLQHATQICRSAMSSLSSAVLDQVGLQAALRSLASQMLDTHDLPIDLHVDPKTETLAPEIQAFFYRAAQKLLHNIATHAQASQASIRIRVLPNSVGMLIKDNGRGLPIETYDRLTPSPETTQSATPKDADQQTRAAQEPLSFLLILDQSCLSLGGKLQIRANTTATQHQSNHDQRPQNQHHQNNPGLTVSIALPNWRHPITEPEEQSKSQIDAGTRSDTKSEATP